MITILLTDNSTYQTDNIQIVSTYLVFIDFQSGDECTMDITDIKRIIS